jgi:hypothetical protein
MHGNLPPGSNARKELRARQSGPGPVRERNLNGRRPGAVFKSTFANACSESVTVCQRLAASVPSHGVLLQAFELSPAALLAHAAAAAAPLPRATHFKLLVWVTVFESSPGPQSESESQTPLRVFS